MSPVSATVYSPNTRDPPAVAGPSTEEEPTTTDPQSAPELRRQIAEIYLIDHPPPGKSRASLIITGLVRKPGCPDLKAMARDLIEVAQLRARLVAARDAARRRQDASLGLLIHGLIGHADAALLGSTDAPGWRAAALDILDPDDEPRASLDAAATERLFALVLAEQPNEAG